VERVWAAWSLALEFGSQVIPELRYCLKVSPVSGTRRHLIVVLAGLDARPTLKRYALEDSHGMVRSTSAQYLIRTSAGSITPALLNRMLNDPSPTVRMSVLQEMDDLRDHLSSDRVE